MEMQDGNKQGILAHLGEFRSRLVKSVIAVAITTAISFIFAEQIFGILIAPAGDIDLIYIEMTEMMGTYMKVCLFSGVILAMPVIVYQLLAFVSPGLTRKERKSVYLILPWIIVMFAIGIYFCYEVLLPPAIKFLISFGSDIAIPQIRIGNYISIVARLLLALGLVFETPVVTSFLVRIGVITHKWLAAKRKGAIIVAFVLAAIITPTFDPLNQTFVAVPLVVLYEMSVWLAKLIERRLDREVVSPSTPTS